MVQPGWGHSSEVHYDDPRESGLLRFLQLGAIQYQKPLNFSRLLGTQDHSRVYLQLRLQLVQKLLRNQNLCQSLRRDAVSQQVLERRY